MDLRTSRPALRALDCVSIAAPVVLTGCGTASTARVADAGGWHGRGQQPVLEQPRFIGTGPHSHAGPLEFGVDHADVLFAFSAGDTMPDLYTSGVTASDIAADLPRLARGGT